MTLLFRETNDILGLRLTREIRTWSGRMTGALSGIPLPLTRMSSCRSLMGRRGLPNGRLLQQGWGILPPTLSWTSGRILSAGGREATIREDHLLEGLLGPWETRRSGWSSALRTIGMIPELQQENAGEVTPLLWSGFAGRA